MHKLYVPDMDIQMTEKRYILCKDVQRFGIEKE